MAYGEYTTLLIDQQGAVLKVTVDRPHVLNAQSRVMREEFDEVLDIAAEDDDVRVVIVAASGDHFSAGHDLGSAEEMADREQRPLTPGYAGAYTRACDLNVANTLRWLRDKRPGGTTPIDGVSSAGLDAAWGRHLEALGKADYLYGVFKLPDPPL